MLVSPSKSLAGIRTLEDLTQENVCAILRHQFGSRELLVKRLPDLEQLSGVNDFYNSEVHVLNVALIRDPSEIDQVDEETPEEVEDLSMVVKVPVRSGFLALRTQALARPFLKEYLW